MVDLPDLADPDAWPDDALDALRSRVLQEQERRYVLATAPARADAEAARYRQAVEAALPPLPEGEHRTWVQPLGAHDAYPVGAVVAHGGRVWENITPANVWEPGRAGVPSGLWRDVTEDAPEPEPVPSAPPWRTGESVRVGDLREYGGAAYAVVQPHTTQAGWEPPAVPALWKQV